MDNALGTAPTSGTITVTDTLPTGLGVRLGHRYLVDLRGGGPGGHLHERRRDRGAGATSPNPITLTVAVASTAVPSVTNSASVSGGNEPAANNGNNTAFDPTNVIAAAVNTFAPDNAQTGAPGTTIFYAHTFNAGSAEQRRLLDHATSPRPPSRDGRRRSTVTPIAAARSTAPRARARSPVPSP